MTRILVALHPGSRDHDPKRLLKEARLILSMTETAACEDSKGGRLTFRRGSSVCLAESSGRFQLTDGQGTVNFTGLRLQGGIVPRLAAIKMAEDLVGAIEDIANAAPADDTLLRHPALAETWHKHVSAFASISEDIRLHVGFASPWNSERFLRAEGPDGTYEIAAPIHRTLLEALPRAVLVHHTEMSSSGTRNVHVSDLHVSARLQMDPMSTLRIVGAHPEAADAGYRVLGTGPAWHVFANAKVGVDAPAQEYLGDAGRAEAMAMDAAAASPSSLDIEFESIEPAGTELATSTGPIPPFRSDVVAMPGPPEKRWTILVGYEAVVRAATREEARAKVEEMIKG